MNQPASIIRERLFYLRPIYRSRRRSSGGFMETVPWVDVVLLILLVFITQSATLKKPGLQVELPSGRATSGARYDAHVLTVPQDGVYFFGDERVHWVVLADRLRDAAEATPESELIIEADGAITHRSLTALYNLAVDVGWRKIVLATRVESPEPPAPYIEP